MALGRWFPKKSQQLCRGGSRSSAGWFYGGELNNFNKHHKLPNRKPWVGYKPFQNNESIYKFMALNPTEILQFSKITSSSRPAQVELMLQLADDKRLGSCVRYNCWVDSREDSTRLYHETLGIWVDITQKMMIRWWLEGCTTQYIGIVTIHWESLLTNHYDYHWNDMYRILRDFTQLLGIWTSKNGRAGYVW